jgi:hypothetical protein
VKYARFLAAARRYIFSQGRWLPASLLCLFYVRLVKSAALFDASVGSSFLLLCGDVGKSNCAVTDALFIRGSGHCRRSQWFDFRQTKAGAEKEAFLVLCFVFWSIPFTCQTALQVLYPMPLEYQLHFGCLYFTGKKTRC